MCHISPPDTNSWSKAKLLVRCSEPTPEGNFLVASESVWIKFLCSGHNVFSSADCIFKRTCQTGFPTSAIALAARCASCDQAAPPYVWFGQRSPATRHTWGLKKWMLQCNNTGKTNVFKNLRSVKEHSGPWYNILHARLLEALAAPVSMETCSETDPSDQFLQSMQESSCRLGHVYCQTFCINALGMWHPVGIANPKVVQALEKSCPTLSKIAWISSPRCHAKHLSTKDKNSLKDWHLKGSRHWASILLAGQRPATWSLLSLNPWPLPVSCCTKLSAQCFAAQHSKCWRHLCLQHSCHPTLHLTFPMLP